MSKFVDPDAKKDSGSEPHPDSDENVKFFRKQMDRVQWLPDEKTCEVTCEIHDMNHDCIFNEDTGEYERTVKEYICVIFSWQERDKDKSFVISFHQPSRKTQKSTGFKEELCAALNFFGQKGYLQHKTRHNNGTPRNTNYQNQWSHFNGNT